MALDAATLALCGREIKELLYDGRIDKIFQPSKDEVLLMMRTKQDRHTLLISARSGLARICITGASYENPQSPPSFCMLLRKHLQGGRLTDVRPMQGDRIIFLDFLCTNEMGDLVDNTLAVELMGRYCNIVLMNSGPRNRDGSAVTGKPLKVVDALKRIGYEDSDIRQLLPGLIYTLPEAREGFDYIYGEAAEISAAVKNTSGRVFDGLKNNISGVGPVLLRELYYRSFGTENKQAENFTHEDGKKLENSLEEIRGDFFSGGRPCLIKNADGVPFEFSFTQLKQYRDGETVFYDSFSQMLEAYYGEKDRTERLRIKGRELRKAVQNMYDRAVRKQAARAEEKQESENSEHLRIKGEILTANLHAFERGRSRVRLMNWYEGRETDIELDLRLSPAENAQKYFKEYKKKQTAAKMLEQLLQQGEKEIKYLETVIYEVDTAEGEAALEEIRGELKEQGYLKYYKGKNKKQKAAGFLRYRSKDGFLILVGRNNLQNEKLSIKTARGKDLWFHTKNAPGSHVVVMSEGADIPLDTQNQAAMLAVWHSSQKNSAKVPVDYTFVKNLRKTGDLPTGMVLYEHYETAYVTADAETIEGIEKL